MKNSNPMFAASLGIAGFLVGRGVAPADADGVAEAFFTNASDFLKAIDSLPNSWEVMTDLGALLTGRLGVDLPDGLDLTVLQARLDLAEQSLATADLLAEAQAITIAGMATSNITTGVVIDPNLMFMGAAQGGLVTTDGVIDVGVGWRSPSPINAMVVSPRGSGPCPIEDTRSEELYYYTVPFNGDPQENPPYNTQMMTGISLMNKVRTVPVRTPTLPVASAPITLLPNELLTLWQPSIGDSAYFLVELDPTTETDAQIASLRMMMFETKHYTLAAGASVSSATAPMMRATSPEALMNGFYVPPNNGGWLGSSSQATPVLAEPLPSKYHRIRKNVMLFEFPFPKMTSKLYGVCFGTDYSRVLHIKSVTSLGVWPQDKGYLNLD